MPSLRRLVSGLMALSLALASLGAAATDPPIELVKDHNYRVLDAPVPSPADRIQVILFYRPADPGMPDVMKAWEAWRQDHNPFVVLVSSPGVLQDEDAMSARVAIALARAGSADDMTPRLVNAIAAGAVSGPDFSSWVRWLGEQGVDTASLVKDVNAPVVREMAAAIPHTLQMYGVSSLPAVVINGRYVIDVSLVSPLDLLPTAKAAVAQLERASVSR